MLPPNPSPPPPPSQWAREDWVSASDISSYTYCPKSYELARVRRAAPTAHAARRRKDGHRAHRRFVRWFGVQRTAARWAVALVVLAGVITWALTWLRGRI